VILIDIVDESRQKKASEIGPNAHYKHCDVTKEEDVAAAVDFAVEKFGKLDIMFNNAGCPSPPEEFETSNIETYDRYHSIMVRGVLLGIKHAARVMVPAKKGVLVNTASICGVLASDDWPLAYAICNHNLPGITNLAACKLGMKGIRVNAVSPHVIPNDLARKVYKTFGVDATMQEMRDCFISPSSLSGRTLSNDDVADGVLFLCSAEGGYVSGQNLVLDGGWCSSKGYNASRDLLMMGQRKNLQG
jgi:xanthoxin dehydrogenase